MRVPAHRSSSRNDDGPVDMRTCGPYVALANAAAKRDQLDRQLHRLLPALLRDQVHLADHKDGCLTFVAPSPAWASRLRLAQTEILTAARSLDIAACRVHVKVVLPARSPVPEPPRAPLSRATAKHLTCAARSVTDPELRDLFLALASVANESNPPTETD